MAKQRFVHAATASGLALFILPAFAEDEQGMKFTVGVEQEFEIGENLGLEDPEEGNTTLSTTRLTFGLDTATHNQSLQVNGGIALRAGEIPRNSDIDTGIVEPRIGFKYMRESANAILTANGNYRESDISFRPAVTDFTNLEGVIELPEDFEDLEGSGTRINYNVGSSLEIGRNSPLGFVFDANIRGIAYDQQSPNLNDIFRYSAGVRANLRFSEVTTGFTAYEFKHFESSNTQNTERDTNSIEVGVVQDISPRANVEAAIGYTEIDQEEFGISTTTSGATGRVSYNLAMPDGSISASYVTSRDQDGVRHNVTVGRFFQLPAAQLSVNVGATKEDGSDVSLIGSLNYSQDLPTGNFRVGVNRNVSVDNNDDERIATTAELAYNYDINNISSLGFDMSYGVVDGSGNSDDTQRTDVSASYNYDLTKDWKLSTGVAYKVRDERNSDRSDSTSFFVKLKRDFEFFR